MPKFIGRYVCIPPKLLGEFFLNSRSLDGGMNCGAVTGAMA